ncbi:glycine cleavage system protein GcvH [Acidithiobacillus montserratensis]|uniref:Glycine cleavage system protein GcvH n=1 Tax=Acidithiobacillus montserratensis TaxID=2729135 RepID=A0ACD5HBE6_9PROT|nr:glycine cleavage system protein GcvH [Acidithiobacillus montserratensis]MBN2678907.1 glycine cleavage system protein GcvH [Acidithiobacillaceae bacterium]MBU2746651.1 glycine cleavage system protein GcvH [Acidithiobacillus montserratensis]
MSKIPESLRYSDTHEWVEDLGGGRYRIGITDHAQELLGDLVYAEVPEVGKTVKAGTVCGVLESVKAAADLYAPIDGTVLERNEGLSDNPQWLNENPYGQGWIMVVSADAAAFDKLLDAAAYSAIEGV